MTQLLRETSNSAIAGNHDRPHLILMFGVYLWWSLEMNEKECFSFHFASNSQFLLRIAFHDHNCAHCYHHFIQLVDHVKNWPRIINLEFQKQTAEEKKNKYKLRFFCFRLLISFPSICINFSWSENFDRRARSEWANIHLFHLSTTNYNQIYYECRSAKNTVSVSNERCSVAEQR